MAVALGSTMSPLPVIGTLHPFCSTLRGQTCKLRAGLLYDEINSVSLSKHLLGVSDVAGWYLVEAGSWPLSDSLSASHRLPR